MAALLRLSKPALSLFKASTFKSVKALVAAVDAKHAVPSQISPVAHLSVPHFPVLEAFDKSAHKTHLVASVQVLQVAPQSLHAPAASLY